ncbi:MAG: hypothetical protein Q4C72_06450 [Eubacteriales bacterium]|nr:hypothetical protein [Eubacteriales bacterium]
MNQTQKMNICSEIHTDTREGWSLWRTVSDRQETEYVLAARENSEQACSVMIRALDSMLEGMSAAVMASDGEGQGRFARTVIRHMADIWPDCRLIARAAGTAFVAIADRENHYPAIKNLLELARDQEQACIRFVGYLEPRLPEVRFAGLFNGGADVELTYSNADQPMLRLRLFGGCMEDREIWSRLRACWTEAIAA